MSQAREGASVYDAATLEDVTDRMLQALGAPADLAELVARSLVLSNLVGHDSHGIVRLIQYSGWIRDGQIQPTARPEVATRRGVIAVVDGKWGFGQPAAQLATAVAIEAAREQGVGLVAIQGCNHIGRLSEYISTIGQAGQMGMTFCNAGPVVAPFGGNGRVMGTNPFAWGVPGPDGNVVVTDFATAAVAEGKLNLALADGLSVEPGILIDRDGRSSTDPADFYAGGALLPFGAHKGSGLSMLIELTAGLLSGMGAAPLPNYEGGNGTLLLAADVAAFRPLDDFIAQVGAFGAEVKRHGDNVLLPGEAEAAAYRTRVADGIPVSDAIRRQITRLADEVDVSLDAFALSG